MAGGQEFMVASVVGSGQDWQWGGMAEDMARVTECLENRWPVWWDLARTGNGAGYFILN